MSGERDDVQGEQSAPLDRLPPRPTTSRRSRSSWTLKSAARVLEEGAWSRIGKPPASPACRGALRPTLASQRGEPTAPPFHPLRRAAPRNVTPSCGPALSLGVSGRSWGASHPLKIILPGSWGADRGAAPPLGACLSRFRRWFDRRPSVADCRCSRNPDCAFGSRPHANATGFALRSDASCEPKGGANGAAIPPPTEGRAAECDRNHRNDQWP
jgi:hypothetical protein